MTRSGKERLWNQCVIQEGLWKKIKKGSTPLQFEKISIDETCYQEITSREKFLEVLQYLHRVGEYKTYANKMVINNVYTYMRMNTLDFTRARSIFDRGKIYHQMLRQEKNYSQLIVGTAI